MLHCNRPQKIAIGSVSCFLLPAKDFVMSYISTIDRAAVVSLPRAVRLLAAPSTKGPRLGRFASAGPAAGLQILLLLATLSGVSLVLSTIIAGAFQAV
jgi:hypothetical protein